MAKVTRRFEITKQFNEIVFEYQRKASDFEDKIEELGPMDFISVIYVTYNNSIEFTYVKNNIELNNKQKKFIFANGFDLIIIKYRSGKEKLIKKHFKEI